MYVCIKSNYKVCLLYFQENVFLFYHFSNIPFVLILYASSPCASLRRSFTLSLLLPFATSTTCPFKVCHAPLYIFSSVSSPTFLSFLPFSSLSYPSLPHSMASSSSIAPRARLNASSHACLTHLPTQLLINTGHNTITEREGGGEGGRQRCT